jgi:hypothetical protein
MAAIAELDTAPETLEAALNYYVDTGDKPISLVAGPGGIDTRLSGGSNEAHVVTLRNGRLMADRFDIEKHGFRFVHHPTKVADFYDEDEVRRVYYPEMEALIKAGGRGQARRRLRPYAAHPGRHGTRNPANPRRRAPGAQRLHRILCRQTRARSDGRRGRGTAERPLRDRPVLAADPAAGRELAARDLRLADARPEEHGRHRAALSGPVGQTAAITFDPNHRWYWFPQMRRDEALVFKVFDSMTDGRSRWTAHTAFDDPTSPPNARFRESIEIRTLAFF